MIAVLKRVGTGAAPADARIRLRAQNPRRTQAAKISATASIIPQRKPSAPGATLTAEQTIEVVRIASMACRLTSKLTGREQPPATLPLEQTEPAAPGPVQRMVGQYHLEALLTSAFPSLPFVRMRTISLFVSLSSSRSNARVDMLSLPGTTNHCNDALASI